MNTTDKRDAGEAAEKIAGLARKVAAHRGHGGGGPRRIPGALRAEILKARQEFGLPMTLLALRIGVSASSIANWTKASPAKRSMTPRRASAVKKEGRHFKQVRVVPEARPEQGKAGRAFELELASGARVRGLRMEDLAELIRIQGGVR